MSMVFCKRVEAWSKRTIMALKKKKLPNRPVILKLRYLRERVVEKISDWRTLANR